MKAWWENLSPREKLALQVLAVVAGLFVVLQLIAAPLGSWRADAERRARLAETNYRLVAEAAAFGDVSAGEDRQTPIRTALREAATANDVTLNFTNERPDGSVEAQAANVAPDKLFGMFAALDQRYGVRVVTADIARLGDNTGLVRAQMTFAR
ncbi:MAG: type II secretion system protein GspM [Pseudomonadota bacterium]|nr:type II secretion system protein GspM [Pseudomonadota bacterium]